MIASRKEIFEALDQEDWIEMTDGDSDTMTMLEEARLAAPSWDSVWLLFPTNTASSSSLHSSKTVRKFGVDMACLRQKGLLLVVLSSASPILPSISPSNGSTTRTASRSKDV
ncbi:unnamed protein product [Pseudo-nitzschia multistriata]|uniref:Uncharacterized protein n=1 Tax=Pseudo-nitzschia multistriata TaxID=183589 RepID=A0A448Z7Y8_9STRA|nr:unnamed protein product [Pseudo-nitzschia multistriata]